MARRILIEMALRRARPGTGSSYALLRRRTAELEWPRVDLALAPVLCAVVGAVATRQYMAERRTADIDVAVYTSDIEAAHNRLRTAGYTETGRLAIGGSSWQAPARQQVDLIEGYEPWWPEAIERAQGNRDLQGLPVLPLPYLTLMKLRAGRTQDLADVSRMLGQADDHAIEETVRMIARYAPTDVPDLKSLIELGRLEWQQPQG